MMEGVFKFLISKSLLFTLLCYFLIPLNVFGQKWQKLDDKYEKHYQSGKYSKALDYAYKELQQAGIEFDTLHYNFILSLNNIAKTYIALGEYHNSEGFIQRALQNWTVQHSKKDSTYAYLLDVLGYSYMNTEQFEKADLIFYESLSIKQELLGKNHVECAYTLKYLGDINSNNSNFQKAEAYYLESLKILEENDNAEIYPVTNSLGNLYNNSGQYRKTEEVLLASINDYQTNKKQNIEEYGISLNILGVAYMNLNVFEKAEQYLLEAEKITYSTYQQYLVIINNLALLYKSIHKYDKADKYYQKAITISKEYSGSRSIEHSRVLSNIAQFYYQQGNFQIAEEYLNESRSNLIELLPEDNVIVGESNYMLGEFYYYTSENEKAYEYLNQALDVLSLHYKPTDPRILNCVNALAYVNIEIFKFEDSKTHFKKNLDNTSKYQYPIFYLYSLSGLAKASYYLADFDSSKIWFQLFFQEISELNLTEDPIYSTSLALAASMYTDLNDFVKAKMLAQESVDAIKKLYGKNHPEYAIRLNILGMVYYKQGNSTLAKSFFIIAKEIIEENEYFKYPGAAGVYNNLGMLYKDLGLTYDAIINLEKAYFYNAANHTILLNLSSLYSSIGDKEEAERCSKQAEELVENAYGKSHPLYAEILLRSAITECDNNDLSKAYIKISDAEHIIAKHYGDSSYQYIDCLEMYAYYFEQSKEHDTEFDYRKRICELNQKHYGEGSVRYINSVVSMAYTYRNLDKINEMMLSLNRGIELAEKYFGPNSPEYIETIDGISYSLYNSKRYKESEFYFRRVLTHQVQDYLPVFSILTSSERNKYLRDLYDFEFYNNFLIRFPSNEQITNSVINNRIFIKGLLSDSEKKFEQQMHSIKDTSLQNTYHKLRKTRDEIAKTVSLPFDENIKQFDNINNLRNEAENLEKTLSRALKESSYGIYEYNQWKSVRDNLNKNEACIEIIKFYYKDYRKTFVINGFGLNFDTTGTYPRINYIYPSSPIDKSELQYNDIIISVNSIDLANKTVQEVRNILSCPEKGIQVKYKRGNTILQTDSPIYCDSVFNIRTYHPVYAAIIITSETKKSPDVVVLENGFDLEYYYYNVYNRSINSTKIDADVNKILYDVYWSKIEKLISNKNKIYLSPDGVYYKINIETLMSDDSTYVADHKSVYLLNSLRDLTNKKVVGPRVNKTALLVGNPEFDSDRLLSVSQTTELEIRNKTNTEYNPARFISGFWLDQLPGTQIEIDGINKLLLSDRWQSTTLSKELASEEAVKNVTNPGILHIATHGYFSNSKTPIEHVDDMDADLKSFYSINTDPLLGSCLFLAGSQKALNGEYNFDENSEDGILTAYEILNMNLDSTEVVILSACETGLGEIKDGQGVYGLQRAFHIAGAQQIVMSLWKVDDLATQLLMTKFYEFWLTGKSVKDALTHAQSYLRSYPRYSRPFYWGAFVVSGLH